MNTEKPRYRWVRCMPMFFVGWKEPGAWVHRTDAGTFMVCIPIEMHPRNEARVRAALLIEDHWPDFSGKVLVPSAFVN